MSKLRLMTIIGTRPDIIKLSETIKRCDEVFAHTLVHTGQNYDARLNDIFYADLSLRAPDIYLDAVGGNLGETMGNIIAKSYAVMRERQPDAVLILGDTNSSLSAISAKRLKVPLFHMEAGNRCFDENLPEELNRRIVDHISDVNLPYTEHARRYLLREGLRGEYVFVTGSPMREVINANRARIDASNVLRELGLQPRRYLLLSAHREENIDDPRHFDSLMDAINRMAATFAMPVIYSVHPRSAKFIAERRQQLHPLVRQMQPFAFSDYNCLQLNAFCVVSDSGTLAEESAILGFRAVSIRTSTERPEAAEKGAFVLGGITAASVVQAINVATSLDVSSAVNDYAEPRVSEVVARLVQGYTPIVNERIWRK